MEMGQSTLKNSRTGTHSRRVCSGHTRRVCSVRDTCGVNRCVGGTSSALGARLCFSSTQMSVCLTRWKKGQCLTIPRAQTTLDARARPGDGASALAGSTSASCLTDPRWLTNSEAMRALRAARWAINYMQPEKQEDGPDAPLSFSQRREALGPPPVRRVVTGPEGVRLGPAQTLMLEREQEVADCEFELATLEYEHSMNEIAAEEQAEEVESRQTVVEKCNLKLGKISEQEEELAERWRVNKEDVKLRKTMGAGRTMKLLEAEMDELDAQGDRLVQERRMAEAEKNEKVRDRADAAEVHDAVLEAGALSR